MSTFDDDPIAGLRRGTDPADTRLADLLGALRDEGRGNLPPASEALAAFLAAPESPVSRLAPVSDLPGLAGSVPLPVIELGSPKPRRHSVKSSLLVPVEKIAKLGLVAKVMLGATVAFAGVGTVAATAALQPGNDKVTIVTPAADPTDAPKAPEGSAAPDDSLDQQFQGHEGVASPEPSEAPESPEPSESPKPSDTPTPVSTHDDQGENNDDQGEVSNDNEEHASTSTPAPAPTADSHDDSHDGSGDSGSDGGSSRESGD